MKKEIKKKLKLNKLTITNLSRLKGGKNCPCDAQIGNGAYNFENLTKQDTICATYCEFETCVGPVCA